MIKHNDGFIGWLPHEVIKLLTLNPPPQFYRLDNWQELFTRCVCHDVQKVGAYQMIDNETARTWAKERTQ